ENSRPCWSHPSIELCELSNTAMFSYDRLLVPRLRSPNSRDGRAIEDPLGEARMKVVDGRLLLAESPARSVRVDSRVFLMTGALSLAITQGFRRLKLRDVCLFL